MEYCAPRGLPHSEFLSWDQSDQDKALGWMMKQGQICHSCGTYPEDWLDEGGRDKDPPPKYAHSRICGGCVTISNKQEEMRAGNDGKINPGVIVYLSSEPPAVTDDDWEEDDGRDL